MCRIRKAGVKCASVGLGSTPTASQPSPRMNDITELHPGNYVFYGQTLYYVDIVTGLVLGYSAGLFVRTATDRMFIHYEKLKLQSKQYQNKRVEDNY